MSTRKNNTCTLYSRATFVDESNPSHVHAALIWSKIPIT